MKRILSPGSSTDVKDFMTLLLRVAAGLLLIISHGFPKFQALTSGQPVQFLDFMGMGATASMTLSMFAEFICASFVVLGLFTRIAAIPVIINLSVIVFHVHGSDPLVVKELPILYLVSFVAILFMGPGKHSLDTLLHRRIFKARAVSMG